MEKINWKNGKTPINQTNLNGMQDNIEKACVAVSPTQPTTNENVWIKKGKNLYNFKNAYITGTSSQNIGLIYRDTIEGQDYTFSANNYSWITIKTYNSSNQIIRTLGNTEDTKNITITIQDTEAYMELIFFSGLNNLNSINSVDFTEVQLEQGTAATDYEPYIEKEIYVKNENGVFERFYSESEDSGVLNLTETGESYAYIKYRKVGKMVQVNSPWYSETGINIPAYGEVLLGTLPQGYEPTNKLNIPIYSKNKNNITSTNCLVSIGTDGKIKIVNSSSIDANNIVAINFNTTYMINE